MGRLRIGIFSCLFISIQLGAQPTNIQSIEQTNQGDFAVLCENNSRGIVSFEERDICVFSHENRKNRCEDETYWTVEDAAYFICDGHITPEAPLFNENTEKNNEDN